MMMDFRAPYAIVVGEPGVSFQQNSQWFRKDGSPVGEIAVHAVDMPDATPEPSDGRLRANGWTDDDLRRPENKALKAQLDVYGEPWTTRRAAMEFLQKGRA